jgi:hypothetical protein
MKWRPGKEQEWVTVGKGESYQAIDIAEIPLTAANPVPLRRNGTLDGRKRLAAIRKLLTTGKKCTITRLHRTGKVLVLSFRSLEQQKKHASLGAGEPMTISKFASMTIGFVLILIGTQLFLVKSWLLTPTATRFFADNFSRNNESQFSGALSGGQRLLDQQSWSGNSGSFTNASPGQSWPYYPSQGSATFSNANSLSQVPATFGSYSGAVAPGYQHRFVPPQWVMWPALFLGTVFLLHGLALRS